MAPIFPKVGLASLVGSSDTGKSTFLRQLALSLALGLDNFVGYKLFPTSRNVIFISTEDDPASTSVSIKKPISKILQNEDHLLFEDLGKDILTSSIATLSHKNPKKDEMLPLIKEMYQSKTPVRQIEAELKKKGYKIGKSSVSNYIKEFKNAEKITNIIEKETENIDFSIENDTIKLEDIL